MKRLQDAVNVKQLKLRSTKKVVEVAKKVVAQLQLKTKCMRKQLSESSTSKLKTTMELGEAKDELANKLYFQGYVEFYEKVNLAYPDYDLDVGDDEDGSEHDEENELLMVVGGNGVRIKLLVERVFV
ncbi:hypothetical protein ACFX13_019816 [Malus domestica]